MRATVHTAVFRHQKVVVILPSNDKTFANLDYARKDKVIEILCKLARSWETDHELQHYTNLKRYIMGDSMVIYHKLPSDPDPAEDQG